LGEPNPIPGPGIRERLRKGISAQGFSQVVQIFIRLVEVPLLLSFWGTQRYGEWLMLSAIPVYLSITDGGFTGAACREMAMRSGAEEHKETAVIFQSTWVLLMIVSIATGLLAFGLVEIAPLESWLGFSSMNAFEVRFTFLLLVAHVLVSFQGDLLNGAFWVTGDYPHSMYLIAFTQLVEFVGFAVVVMLGGGPIKAAAGYLVGRILGTGMMWIGQRRASPWLRPGHINASLTEIKRLAFPAFTSLAFPVGNALNIQGMRLVVGIALGPSAVALFVPMRTLSRLVMQPANIINRLIEPELAVAYGAGNRALFQQIFTISCQFALWGCLGLCFLVGPGAYWIFPAWTSGMVSMHWPTYLVLLSVVLINSVWYTALMVPYAINSHSRIAPFFALVYGAAAIGCGYICSVKLGIGGAALTLLAAEVAMVVVVIHVSLPMARIGMTQWAKIVLRPPFDLIGSAGMYYWKRKSAAPVGSAGRDV
jgi:O-antigen/teichoic acid export membrane protein